MALPDPQAAIGVIKSCWDRVQLVRTNEQDAREVQEVLRQTEEAVKRARVDSNLPEAQKFNDALAQVENLISQLLREVSAQVQRHIVSKTWDATGIEAKFSRMYRKLQLCSIQFHYETSGYQVAQGDALLKGQDALLEGQDTLKKGQDAFLHKMNRTLAELKTLQLQYNTAPASEPTPAVPTQPVVPRRGRSKRRNSEGGAADQHRRQEDSDQEVIEASRHISEHDGILQLDGTSVRVKKKGNGQFTLNTKIKTGIQTTIVDDYAHIVKGVKAKIHYAWKGREIVRTYMDTGVKDVITFLENDRDSSKLARAWYKLVLKLHQGEMAPVAKTPPQVTVDVSSVHPICKRYQGGCLETKKTYNTSWRRAWQGTAVRDVTERRKPLPSISFQSSRSWYKITLAGMEVTQTGGPTDGDELLRRTDVHASQDSAERAYKMEVAALRQRAADVKVRGKKGDGHVTHTAQRE